MAVVMIMRWDGISLEQYEQARATVHWETDVPAGAIYHVAAHDGTALRVTDVWATAEDFQRFVDTRLMPGVRELGIEGEPTVEIYPAHALFAPAYSVQIPAARANA